MELFHGGIGDLWKGSIVKPNMAHARYLDGCPSCEAQKNGTSALFGFDPETPAHFVYATSDREYARYYASRAVKGWLYEVELDPDSVEPSTEDLFPTWRAASARIIQVLEKRITLTMPERKALFIRRGGTGPEFESMISTIDQQFKERLAREG